MAKENGSIERLEDHHHWAATLLADDKNSSEVSEITGMSVARVAALKADPSFARLVNVLKGKVTEFNAFTAVDKKFELALLQVWEQIVYRLETSPGKFTTKELLEIGAEAADRLGRTKVLRSQRVTMNMDQAEILAEAKRRELKLVNKSK